MKEALICVGKHFECYLPVKGLVDLDNERKRIASEIQRVERIVKQLEGKLQNKNFVERVSKNVLQVTRSQRDNMNHQLQTLQKILKSLI